MTKNASGSLHSGKNELYTAILSIFSKHPSRVFNYKQLLKLLQQNYSQVAQKYLFTDDRNKNRVAVEGSLQLIEKDGEIEQVEIGRYRYVPKQVFLEGIIQIKGSGTGYVMNENYDEDILISPFNNSFSIIAHTEMNEIEPFKAL